MNLMQNKQYYHDEREDDNDNGGNTFVSDNWQTPLSDNGKIQSVEQLSDFGRNLLCGSLFTGDDVETNTENIYAEWSEKYEHDMNTLQFDSLKTMPEKVEAYLNEIPEINDDKNTDDINILDVGAGTGKLGELLMENSEILDTDRKDENTNDIVIDGMDLTQEMLDILEKERGDIYNEVLQHDITETPWPFETDKYDLSVCNGVLVYVKDNIEECLNEFIRVTKPGGHCLLMLRHDCLNEFSHSIYQLITDKKWEIAEITDTRYNFKAKIQNKNKYFVPYNHHIFQVL